MSGEFEPNDSRNVTGAASTPDGRWTAQGQQPPLANGETPSSPARSEDSQEPTRAQGGGGAGGGGPSGDGAGDMSEDVGSDDVDGEEGVQFHPDQELIRKVGEDGGAGGLSSEGEGEDMENRNMGSESGSNQGASDQSLGQANESGWPGQQNSGTEASQQQQFSGSAGGQMGSEPGQQGSLGEQIREHMRVVDAEGTQIGTVDSFENDQIKLTRSGSSDGEHHYLPIDRVAGIEGETIRLHETGQSVFGNNGS